MSIELFPATDRGHANYGWLNTWHHFSFANYYNPLRERFGLLRVLNDDTIQAGTGFNEHPHENMEIISIPLEGALEHHDSMGNTTVIRSGEIQVMSAGTGIRHSEFNHSKSELAKFLQIWIFPKQKDIVPRYDQKKFASPPPLNIFQTYVSPEKNTGTLWINQDAWLCRAAISAQSEVTYQKQKEANGIFIFVISGEIIIDGNTLKNRDAIGITGMSEISVKGNTEADVLLIEVPMD
jgi:quercetin 2,3-dioxygenase